MSLPEFTSTAPADIKPVGFFEFLLLLLVICFGLGWCTAETDNEILVAQMAQCQGE